MKENIMPPLPKPIGFKQLVKMVADTNPKELQEHKKKQKENQSSNNKSKS